MSEYLELSEWFEKEFRTWAAFVKHSATITDPHMYAFAEKIISFKLNENKIPDQNQLTQMFMNSKVALLFVPYRL